MTAIVAIPGAELQVGDVLLPSPDSRMARVDRITLVMRVGPYHLNPLLLAHGTTKYDNREMPFTDWSESFYADEWVVVER